MPYSPTLVSDRNFSQQVAQTFWSSCMPLHLKRVLVQNHKHSWYAFQALLYKLHLFLCTRDCCNGNSNGSEIVNSGYRLPADWRYSPVSVGFVRVSKEPVYPEGPRTDCSDSQVRTGRACSFCRFTGIDCRSCQAIPLIVCILPKESY